MPKVKVTIPAVCVGLGPGIDSLSLALSLHNTVEMSLQPGMKPAIQVVGEGSDIFPLTASYPAMKAVSRFAQQQNIESPSVFIQCTSNIPVDCGLGDAATWIIGGMVGINNLLPDMKPVSRDWIIAEAAGMVDRPAQAVTAVLGGLTLTSGREGDLTYKRLDIRPMQVVLVIPIVDGYKSQLSKVKDKKIDLKDTLANISRVPLVVEALRTNDMRLLNNTLKDQVVTPNRKMLIPNYDQVLEAARQSGAAGVTLAGSGPAMLAFASNNHQSIEIAMKDAFRQAGIEARTWTLNTDSQGIAISFRQ